MKIEAQEAKQKREDAIKFRIQLSKLRSAGDDTKKRNSLFEKYKNDPKFKQYIELSGGASKAGITQDEWNKLEGKTSPSKEEKEPHEDASSEDEGIEPDANNLARKEDVSDKDVSRHSFLNSLRYCFAHYFYCIFNGQLFIEPYILTSSHQE